MAACLASCVAETVMTGFLGGGHAIFWDGRRAWNLDCFCAVPRGRGELVDLAVGFGEETVHYAIGPASCAVPGLPAGSTHSGGGTGACRGHASWNLRLRSRRRVWRCRRRTRPVSPCSNRS